jgi:hypothetical protein
MDRPRLIRGLRIAWTAFFGFFCVLLIVFWVRSYSVVKVSRLKKPSFVSPGYPLCYRMEASQCLPSPRLVAPASDHIKKSCRFVGTPSASGMASIGDGLQTASAYMHFWVPVLLSVVFAAVPWLRWKFSLRTLLIATTLVAVVLGVVVAFRN